MHENAIYDGPIVAGPVTVPAATVVTGQITSDGVFVKGDGAVTFEETDRATTTRTSRREFNVGDWIFDPNQLAGEGEVRRIKSIDDRTELIELEEAFTADIAAAINLQIIRDSIIKSLSISNVGLADGVLNNNPIKPGEAIGVVIRDKNKRGVDPQVINGTGTELKILKVRY